MNKQQKYNAYTAIHTESKNGSNIIPVVRAAKALTGLRVALVDPITYLEHFKAALDCETQKYESNK